MLVSLSHSSLQPLISRRGVHILPTDLLSGKATFWIIVGIYKVRECPLAYAHVMRLVPCHANAPESQCVEPLYELLSGPGEVVLQLNEHCSRALLLHCCTETHDYGCRGCSTTHPTQVSVDGHVDASIIGQWRCNVLGSQQGYPSRSA